MPDVRLPRLDSGVDAVEDLARFRRIVSEAQKDDGNYEDGNLITKFRGNRNRQIATRFVAVLYSFIQYKLYPIDKIKLQKPSLQFFREYQLNFSFFIEDGCAECR